jgi:hypothetical protein
MAWRKWLVRSLVFSVLGLAVVAALVYEAWTNPAAVRRQVLAKLNQLFQGATVSLDSARLRLLGGIGIRDLRMGRRDQLDRGDFLYVPSAVIYHDKEHLLDGTLAIRKVELDRPRLRIVRERDGQINLAGLLAPPDLSEHVPTLIIHQGIIVIEDRRNAAAVVLEIKQANLTVVNDPLSTLVIEGSGQTDALGAVQINARFHRLTGAISAVIELPEVPIGPPLVQRLAGFCPDLVRHVRDLSGVANIQTTLAYQPSAVPPWRYDVCFELNKGEWRHESLPTPLQNIHAKLHCINGRIPHGELRACAQSATVELDLWDLVWPAQQPKSWEDILAKLEAKVEHVTVTPEFFEHLSKACQKIKKLYNPIGPVSLSCRFQHSDAKHWEKHWTIQPEGMSAEFESFRYPIDSVTGVVTVDSWSDGPDRILVDLRGQGSGRPLVVHGAIQGDKNSEVALNIAADDVPIDHKLLSALPLSSLKLAQKFLPSASRDLGKSGQPLRLIRPAGLANIKVFVRRARGHENFANRYLISFRDTSVKYDLFPYPLENVTGVLDIQPDHWECSNFHGSHKGGDIWVNNACSYRADDEQGQPSDCVQVEIHGKDILLDPEFEQALSPPEVPGRAALRQAWAMLALRGRLSFESIVRDHPDQPQDIDVIVDVKGCSMQPDFFRYSMTDVEANVRYKQGRVYVKDVSAKHGPCRLTLKDAAIALKPAGGFTAWFTDICGEDLLPDEDFLLALHPLLRRGLEPLQIHKPLFVRAAKLVLDAAAAPGEPMKIWWDGGADLRQQTFQAGVEIDGVDGIVWCRGHYNGRQLESVKGNAVFERATILGQPFTNLRGRIEVAPETPDTLKLFELGGDLFGGFVGGEARFKFGSPLSYDVKLDALRIQLEQFGKHNHLGADAQLQGPARAAVHLTGEGSDLTGLRGNGCIEVARGKMYRLPLLLGLLKAFGLRLPDQTAFEQAQVVFGIEGPKMLVHRLDLFGNAISLRGQGTVNLDGSNLNLDFSADWGRVPQMLPPGIRDLSQAFSDQLFRIKLRGKITAPRFEKEAIPGVVDPIKKAFGKS